MVPQGVPARCLMRDTAGTGTVGGHMPAVGAKGTPRELTAPGVKGIQTTLRSEWFESKRHLMSDIEFANDVCDSVRQGVNIGYTGPNKKIICKNWPSALDLSEHIDEFITTNLEKGRIEGPLGTEEQLPNNFRSSPLGAFFKKNGKDVRVIHDLSHPKGDSVNSGVSIDTSVTYSTVLDAVKLLTLTHI